MANLNFKCDDCGKDFPVHFLWLKPKDLSCPHCGSKKISEVKTACACSQDNKSGFKFT